VDVIAREGWEAVTVRKIAARAGVNFALVNYHFGSKTNVMVAAIESAFNREIVTPIGDAFAGEDPAWVIGSLVRLTLGPDLPDTTRRVFESAMGAVAHDPELATRLRPVLDRFRTRLTAVFERATTAHQLPADTDAETLAILFTAMLDGLGLQRMIDPNMPIDRIAAAARRLVTPHDESPPT
jgi:AcrR family transcriptional regulator